MAFQTIWSFGPSLKYKVKQTFIVIPNYISSHSIDFLNIYIYWNFINKYSYGEIKNEKIGEIFTLEGIVN